MAGIFGDWGQKPTNYDPRINNAQYFSAMMNDLSGLMQSGVFTGPHKSTFNDELSGIINRQADSSADKVWGVGESDGRLYRYNKATGETEWVDGEAPPDEFQPLTADQFEKEFGFKPNRTQLGSYNSAVKAGDKELASKRVETLRQKRNQFTDSVYKDFTKQTGYLSKVVDTGEAAIRRLNNPAASGAEQIETLYDFIGVIAKDDSAKREGELALGQTAQTMMQQLTVLAERAKGSGSNVLSPELAREMNRIILQGARIAQSKRRQALASAQKRADIYGAERSAVGQKKPDLTQPRDYNEVAAERKELVEAKDRVPIGRVVTVEESGRQYRRVPGPFGWEYVGMKK